MSENKITLVIPELAQSFSALGQRMPGFSKLKKILDNPGRLAALSNEALAFKLVANWECAALPSASMSALGEGLPAATAWMRADPVELTVDMTHIYCRGSRHVTLTEEERVELQQLLNPIIKDFNLELIFRSPNRGYLRCHKVPKVHTVSPETIRGQSIAHYLPSGEDKPFWLRLFTEIQMQLFGSELNKKRKNRGVATIDALWFWGAGDAAINSAVSNYELIISDDEVVRGLAKASRTPLEVFDHTQVAQYLAKQQNVLIWVSHLLNFMQDNTQFLVQAKVLLEPLLVAINDRKITSLELYPGDKHCYDVTLNVLRTWWKLWSRK